MDDGLPAGELAAVLDDLWRINQRFGGVSGSMRLLDLFFERTGRHSVRILDVGAGDGRLASELVRRLNGRGIAADCVAVDRQIAHLLHGNDGGRKIGRAAADVFSLPFGRSSFEIVICNLFLHHFSGSSAREVLTSMADVAGEAVLINDLDRRWLPYLLIRFAPFMVRHPISRMDGRASIRQAYNRAELLRLGEESGAGTPEWVQLPRYRHGLILWQTRA